MLYCMEQFFHQHRISHSSCLSHQPRRKFAKTQRISVPLACPVSRFWLSMTSKEGYKKSLREQKGNWIQERSQGQRTFNDKVLLEPRWHQVFRVYGLDGQKGIINLHKYLMAKIVQDALSWMQQVNPERCGFKGYPRKPTAPTSLTTHQAILFSSD